MGEPLIEKIHHEDPANARRLVELLRPHETHALFLLGNLVNGFPDSHLYVAREGDRWVGAAGFYGRPKSCSLFAADPQAARGLVRHVAGEHPAVEMVLAVDPVGRIAYEEMLQLGFVSSGDPREVFMELEIPRHWERVPHEENARPMERRDGPAVARLVRLLDWDQDRAPIREEEIRRALMNKMRIVLEIDGEVVSTATTNGLAIEAFQILGVATFPQHRGRGYARAICAALIRQMQAKGAKRCVLFTGTENVAAQRCYEGLGFRVVGMYYMAKFRRPA